MGNTNTNLQGVGNGANSSLQGFGAAGSTMQGIGTNRFGLGSLGNNVNLTGIGTNIYIIM